MDYAVRIWFSLGLMNGVGKWITVQPADDESLYTAIDREWHKLPRPKGCTSSTVATVYDSNGYEVKDWPEWR